MKIHRCVICQRRFEASGRGRPPKACPEHRKLARNLRDRRRYHAEPEPVPPCCQEAPTRRCEQHRQFAKFTRDTWHQPVDTEAADAIVAAFGLPSGSRFLSGYSISRLGSRAFRRVSTGRTARRHPAAE